MSKTKVNMFPIYNNGAPYRVKISDSKDNPDRYEIKVYLPNQSKLKLKKWTKAYTAYIGKYTNMTYEEIAIKAIERYEIVFKRINYVYKYE